MRGRIGVVVLVVLSGLPLAGCATGSSGGPGTPKPQTFTVWYRDDAPPVERVLRAPVDTVWAALPGAFTDLGYSGGPSTSAAERIFLTPSLTIRGSLYDGELNSVYLDCGLTSTGTPAADAYGITFTILARITPADSGHTRVAVLVDGRARSRTHSSNVVYCSGTGRLEAALLVRLEQRVGLGATSR